MTFEVTENALVLTLECERAVKWDDADSFTKGLKHLAQGTKAVDVCAVVSGRGGVYLELKDFRAHRIENKERLTSAALADEVVEKVRDTLAALIWACGRELGTPDLERLVDPYVNDRDQKPLVVLWLEEDRSDPAGAAMLATQIRSKLKPFLNAKVVVTSCWLEQETNQPLSWITVRRSPKART